jgi:hypothetical protein
LPGGRIEVNETPESCLMREFKEETGLQVAIGPCVGSGVLTIAPPHVPCATDVWIWAYGCHLQGIAIPADLGEWGSVTAISTRSEDCFNVSTADGSAAGHRTASRRILAGSSKRSYAPERCINFYAQIGP